MKYSSRLISLLIPLILLPACSQDQAEVTSVIPSVKVQEVTEQQRGKERRISGKLIAADQTELSFSVSGTVATVLVSPGQTVTKGDVLANLDKKPFVLAVNQYKAELGIARTQKNDKQKRFSRLKELQKKGLISISDYDVAESELNISKGNLKIAESKLEDSLRELKNISLKAPFNGKVVARSIDAFQEISAGNSAFVIESNGNLEVDLLVSETLIRNIDYGQLVSVKFPTMQEMNLSGYVSEIGSQVIAGNAFPVKVQLQGNYSDLRSGMSAIVAFNFNTEQSNKSVFLVPISALAIDAGLLANYEASSQVERKASLFIFDEIESKVKIMKVNVGDIRGNLLEVTDGLKIGDLVIVAGVPFLRDGMDVKRWNPKSGFNQ